MTGIVSSRRLSNRPLSSTSKAGARPDLIARPSESIWSRPAFSYWAFAVNAVLILAFWWFSSGFEISRSLADAANGVGRITGLLGTYLVLWQLLLLARVAWLEDAFGLERLAVLHRWNGFLCVSLLVAHGVFQTFGYMLTNHQGVLAQLGDFINSYVGLLAAIVALGLFIAVAVVSITAARRRLSYETWYFLHLYTYIAVALAFSHQLATGVDFAGNPLFVFYWCLLYAFVIGALLLYRVVGPLVAYRRHRFYVQSVEREARNVSSVYIGGHGLRDFEVRAGQFAMWRFLDAKRWWQSHPFSVSAVPDGRRLRITVKNIGDFTSGVHALKPGTPVLVEGPFGRFVDPPATRKVLLIAGGIGITPLRPLAEELARAGFEVRLIYRAHGPADVVFRKEIDELAQELGVQVDYLLSEGAARGGDRGGWFAPARLARLVPDIAERAVYLCGPPRMRKAVLSALRELDVPAEHVRTEVFRLQ